VSKTVVPFTRAERPPEPVTSRRDELAVYTVKEVSKLLRLSLGVTYALIRAGEIPAKKMGARWVIPKRRFHTWLDNDAEPESETDHRKEAG
jgi:excisionase family DNA binding protein